GRLYVRVGFRRAALLGTGLIALGSAPLVGLGPQSPLLLASVAMGLCGIGLGICSPTFLLAPQSAVPWNLRGVITSSTQFFRTIGGSVGIALLGALLNWRLASDLGAAGLGDEADSLVNAVLSSAGRAVLPPETLQQLSLALADGLHLVFLAMFAVALLGLAQVILFAATPSHSQPEPEPTLERAGQRA